MLERGFPHESTAFDAEMILRDRKWIFPANFFDCDTADRFAVGHDVMGIIWCAQQITVEAAALTHVVEAIATVTERDGDRIVGVTRSNQHGYL